MSGRAAARLQAIGAAGDEDASHGYRAFNSFDRSMHVASPTVPSSPCLGILNN
jgi:hypothetical protein